MTIDGDVLVQTELDGREIAPVSLELLGIGKEIAEELNTDLSSSVLGHEIGEAANEAASYSDKVYSIDHPLLSDFYPELYAEAMENLCEEIEPGILLLAHTYRGADIAPRLSYRLKTNLTTDCLEIKVNEENGRLERTKQVYGGNVKATFTYENDPQLVTIRPKVMDPLESQPDEGEIIDFDPEIGENMKETEIIERVEEEAVKLDNADAIVSGGRGIGEEEGFKDLKELASVLEQSYGKVEIGSSRPPVDSGWVPSSRQIGLTGEKVSPKLYIAVGISGATQHLVGMSNSGKIIAINNDPNATIFEMSDYGVVGDYEEVLPSFKTKLEEIL